MKTLTIASLKGRNVRVTWRGEGDWPVFRLLDCADGWVLLQGLDDEDGNPYESGPILVPADQIDNIEILLERNDA